MKITVGQFNVKSKAVAENYSQIKLLIEEAIKNEFEVIVFGDLFKSSDFVDEVIKYQKKLKALAKNITIIFGGLTSLENSLFNTAIVYSNDGEDYSFKHNLHKREFLESEYFTSGENLVVKINDQKVLVTFRDDLAHLDEYTFDSIIVLDSSPVNRLPVININQNIVYANTVGVTAVDKVVWINGGNSYVKEYDLYLTFNQALDTGIINKIGESQTVTKLQALTAGIKTWSDQTFKTNKKWIVGSSGGLDSSVTTALLTIALGSENVITYNLPSKYNKDITINNARTLAKKLSIKHHEDTIQGLVDETFLTLSNFGYNDILGFDEENIQARARGYLLSAFSALENAVIANNGNKLELILGYATIYGDTIGALSLIGDLNKTEVFELASEINEYFDDEIILPNLLPKVDDFMVKWETAPSAELKIDQVDPMKWFYHDLLLDLILTYSHEDILARYLDDQFQGMSIGDWLKFYGLTNGKNFVDDFNWFIKTMQINQFKRLQTPPVLVYGNKVVGIDFKESSNILQKSEYYLKLEEEIINKY